MNIKRVSLFAALVLGGLVACAFTASAQEAKEGKKGERGQMSQQRIEAMAKELNLNEQQKTKVTAVFEDQGKKMRELRDLPQDQRREKFTALRQETDKKLKEILTPEQWQKWEKSREQYRQKGGEGKAKKKE